MTKKTKYFKNCLGVFQGGGCKALAFVGAYRESIDRGVYFSGVAGTSAGSIISALIAAGASPDFLEKAVSELDFESLIKAPSQSIRSGQFKRIPLWVPNQNYKHIATFLKFLGIYSSEQIQVWVEEQLRSLLRKPETEKVKFKDLDIPLSIVATELGVSMPKVWSTELTPEDSVSEAVRASCTIPIFFQPVDSKFIDGGLVSNLPTFTLQGKNSGGFEKLLCFTFNNQLSVPRTKKIGVKEYLGSLVSTAIEGAVKIQAELHQNLHVIEITDLPLETLDFDKVNSESASKMFEAGKTAASNFFESEIAKIKDDIQSRRILATEPQTLNNLAREDVSAEDQVIISLQDTRLVWNLFPTMLNWRLAGAGVDFITSPLHHRVRPQDVEKEQFRRLIMKCLGINTIEADSLAFEGVLFHRTNSVKSAVIFHQERTSDKNPCFAIRYEKTFDATALDSIYKSLQCYFASPTQRFIPEVSIEQGGEEELFNRLQKLDQYSSAGVQMTLEEVDVEKIVFLTKYVKSYKFHQIEKLIEIFRSKGIRLFDCAKITYKMDQFEVTMPITPPVAEEHGGFLYLMEGNSRLTYLIKELRQKKVRLVVVRNVTARLPTEGKFSSQQLLVSDEDKKGKNRYDKFDYSQYRKIEEYARHPSLYENFYDE